MRLFISYAHVDRPQVQQLVDILRVGSHDPWFDHSLIVGGDWQKQLLDAIQRSDAFVYALTPESVASEWCKWEFSQAIKAGKPIVPVLMQKNTKLPDVLKRYQYADFTDGPTPEAVARLMGGLYSVTVTIPPEQAPIAPKNPNGTPSQAMGTASMPEATPKEPVKFWSRLNTQLGVAVVSALIGGICLILAAVVGLIPYITQQQQAQAATSTAAAVETQNVFASRTALSLVPTTTNTALPTFIATATNTQRAAATAPATPTNTPVPPTSTATLTSSPTPSFMAIQPTSTTVPTIPTQTPLPAISPTTAVTLAIPSSTPRFPCDAKIAGTNSSVRVRTYVGDSGYDPDAPVPVYEGEVVKIESSERKYGKLWYQLESQNGQNLGYIPAVVDGNDQSILSAACPRP